MTEPIYMSAGEDDAEELRQAIEAGRKHKIAGEVLTEFLDNRREDIVRDLEAGTCMSPEVVSSSLAELRVMKLFRSVASQKIQLGEIAEERMKKIGG